MLDFVVAAQVLLGSGECGIVWESVLQDSPCDECHTLEARWATGGRE